MTNLLPKTPKDLLNLKWYEAILYYTIIEFMKFFKLWKYPISAQGDLEKMGVMDIAYWIYKATDPIKVAKKNSGLEDFFSSPDNCFKKTLPESFNQQHSVTISAAGDLMPNSYLANSKSCLYKDENVRKVIFDADIKMANLECVVIKKSDREFKFVTDKGPPLQCTVDEYDTLTGGEFDKFTFVATACNHTLDFGEIGIRSTVESLHDKEILFNGINQSEAQAQQATIITYNNVKVGVVAYTFGLNAYTPPTDRPYLVNKLNLNDLLEDIDFSQIKKQIEYCRQTEVDFVIAHLHWGLEHEFYPMPRQLDVAHHLAELGIDAIIGHHPHVVQPVEYYQTTKDPSRIVPIFYSLGNLTTPFSLIEYTVSYVANMELSKGMCDDGQQRTYVTNCQHTSVVQVDDVDRQQISLHKLEKLP
ncbi:MAG: CapA family protein [Bacteriovoracaceae bacterium]|nr:CapA family protein [Bacteriovoracaceae bacterium]